MRNNILTVWLSGRADRRDSFTALISIPERVSECSEKCVSITLLCKEWLIDLGCIQYLDRVLVHELINVPKQGFRTLSGNIRQRIGVFLQRS